MVWILIVLLATGASVGLWVWTHYREARDLEDLRSCSSNLRRIGQAMLLYANENRGQIAPNFDALKSYLGEFPVCQWAARHGKREPGVIPTGAYVYVAPQLKSAPKEGALQFVAAYEPLSYHDGTGMNVLYMDGHVNWIGPSEARWLVSELAAGFNPPRPDTSK